MENYLKKLLMDTLQEQLDYMEDRGNLEVVLSVNDENLQLMKNLNIWCVENNIEEWEHMSIERGEIYTNQHVLHKFLMAQIEKL